MRRRSRRRSACCAPVHACDADTCVRARCAAVKTLTARCARERSPSRRVGARAAAYCALTRSRHGAHRETGGAFRSTSRPSDAGKVPAALKCWERGGGNTWTYAFLREHRTPTSIPRTIGSGYPRSCSEYTTNHHLSCPCVGACAAAPPGQRCRGIAGRRAAVRGAAAERTDPRRHALVLG